MMCRHRHIGSLPCTTKIEIEMMQLQTKEQQKLTATTRNQEEVTKNFTQRKHGLADNLILNFGFQNCENINFCCFKSPCLWCFINIALENRYIAFSLNSFTYFHFISLHCTIHILIGLLKLPFLCNEAEFLYLSIHHNLKFKM